MDVFFPMLSGQWFWWIAAAVLLTGELIMPGFFLLWLAVAAGLTGIADWLFGFSWQGEIATFCGLAILSVLSSWRFVMSKRNMQSDQPHLNQRQNAYVGRRTALMQPIVNGTGKVRFDDALWEVSGPDLPAGTQVIVTGVDGRVLTVETVN